MDDWVERVDASLETEGPQHSRTGRLRRRDTSPFSALAIRASP